jgi:hypothetical protein
MQVFARPASRPALWIARFTTAAVVVFCLGFLAHTSHDPVVLGKYNLRYASFLVLLFLVLIPLFYATVRFLTVAHEIKRADGRAALVKPRQKLTIAALMALIGYVGGDWLVGRVVAGKVLTHDAHVFHPYLQNVARPNHAGQHTNRWGFRGDDIAVNQGADTFRVFVFGGSTVHCGTIDYEQTHCRILEKRLRAAYPDYHIEVQNLGAEWHSTEHDTIKLLFFAQDFAPDLAIMFHGINDLVRGFEPDLFSEGPYRSDYRHYLGAVTNLVRPSSAGTLANVAAGHWCSDLRFDRVRLVGPHGTGIHDLRTFFYPKSRPVEIDEWRSLPAFQRNLSDFVMIARMKQVQVLLATQPSLYRLDLTPREQELLGFPHSHQFHGQRASLASMVKGMQTFNDATRRIARETGTPLVDLERLMPKTTRYLYDDVHYTPAGNALVGDAFADDIIASGIVTETMRLRQRSGPSRSQRPSQPMAAGETTRRRR